MEQWMRSQEGDWILQKSKRRGASDREKSIQLGKPSKEGGQKRGRGGTAIIPLLHLKQTRIIIRNKESTNL